MIRNTYVVLLGMLVLAFGAAGADATGPTLTINSISMPPNSTAEVVVSGSIAGASTFGVNILVEIAPRIGTTGTLEFTPEPPLDIVQAGDPWPGVGIFTPFDTATTFSTILNGSVDDNGSLVPGPVTFTGDLSSFPVVASPGASGVWDLRLTTFVGDSSWEGLATKLFSGTVTVAADTCSLDVHCDDGVPCTDDTCVAGTCVFAPNDANCADDGVFCNGLEVCNAAAGCVSAGNPCLPTEFCNETTNTCDECQVNADCDDGLFCTGVETCVAGTCQPGSDPCAGGACDEVSDSCFTTATMSTGDISMPPNTTGTVRVFGAINGDSTFAANILVELVPRAGAIGTLEFTPEPPVDITQVGDAWPGVGTFSPFDTGSTLSVLLNGSTDVSGSAAAPVVFTGDLSAFPVVASLGASGVWDVRLSTSVGNSNWESLTTSLVDGSITVAVGTCSQDSHCDDGVACTVDTCVAGSCAFTPDNGSCSDGNPCTDNTCNPAVGCETTNNTVSCEDGNACTAGDTCSLGICVGGAPPNCNDGNVCTDDSCNPAIGCVNTNNVAACDDGSACTTADTCSAGTCVGGAPPNCDDGNGCTDDSCDPATGCVNSNNTAACDDGSACTTGDTCAAGICVGGAPPNCDDGNVCTDDSCNPATGCVNTNNIAACDDGSACTTNDTCSLGVCVGGAPPNCNDGNVCTDDSCNPATGCVNTNNVAPCNDGSACTTADTCAAGICVGGAPPNCDDGSVCTDDTCNPATGCVNTNNIAACDDGSACTTGDTCAAGICVGGAPPNCDDGNVCTDDSCNPATGCVNTNNIAACDDGSACTTNDTCAAGICVGGVPPNCDDGNVCTDDTCNPATGCVNTNNIAACDDGSACTTNDTCAAGICVGGAPPNCDDGNVCTDDSCNPAIGCVNADNIAPCDDGSACTTSDTCSLGICVGGTPPNCDDGNVCTDDSCNPATGCVNTDNTAPCDDGSACTTSDTCSLGICVGGAAPNCDDGNVCTDDSCNPAIGCVNTNNIAACDDGSACTTGDTCAAGICVGGVPPNCNDGNVCTDDSCNPAVGCVNTNNVAPCDDGQFCTAVDTCAAGACVGSGAACPGQLCDETANVCVDCFLNIDCDDGIGCTDDTCVGGACVLTANNANCPDDGLFCNGTESCDPILDCVSSGDPCLAGEFCNDAVDLCLECVISANCDDGVACTDDSCVNGSCVNTVNDANCPDDGLFCTGSEVCDAVLDCVSAGDPCQPGELCDEINNSCGECLVDLDCNDGVGCTDDTCVGGACVHTPNNTLCPDDGLFCSGIESCDALLDCVSSGSPCLPTEICNEIQDVCLQCEISADCNDSVPCTDDTCISGICVFTANNANCASDGLFCNGLEVCDALLDCVSPGDPCLPGQLCDEVADSCGECLIDLDCDDAVACTDDTCVAGACVFTANDVNCLDDGLFCNGLEICDAVADCVSTGDPCLPGQLCDEVTDTCGECLVDLDCDDAVPCTVDTCVGGACVFTTNDANCADDGVFCNGLEVCDAVLDCVSTGDPCQAGQLCNEVTDTCGECLNDLDCDDGVACTDDGCVVGVCVNVVNDINCVDDGLFCNGVESCDALLDCVSAGDPCLPGQFCDETTDTCGECLINADCSDGVQCTDDTCVGGACVFTANNVNCPDDGQFCNGGESCDAILGCVSSGDPCPVGLLCNEVTNTCGECLTGADCNDNVACTDDLCVGGGCLFAPNNLNCSDDGLFCNGPEVCDLKLDCVSAGDPCGAGQLCDEVADSCGECLVDVDCDNGQFCDGAETCLGGACQPGSDPCVGQLCDEVVDTCVECLGDADCDDGNDCTQNLCNAGVCGFPSLADGSVCGVAPAGGCDLQDTCLLGACVDNVRLAGSQCRAAAGECDVAEVCDGFSQGCPLDGFVVDGTGCTDEGNECTNDVCAAGTCAHPPRADGTLCGGAPAGTCDLQDLCVVGFCVDNVRSAGTVCRSAASECDATEVCDGASGACPLDGFQQAGVVCADDLVECTNDFCDGLGACVHPPVTDGIICGAAPVGDCDAADTCLGGACFDQVQPISTVCRPVQSECDVADSCDGVGKDCSVDLFQPAGLPCADEGNECTSDACDGNGACAHTPVAEGTACLDEGNACTDDVCASGICAHPALSAGTPCGNPADTECDNPDSCDGGGTCLNNAEPVATVCGDPTDTECENPDSCNGSGACISNAEPSGTACGNPAGSQCDQPDSCDGSGACQSNILASGTPCGNPANSFCDDADTCDGVGACDANLFVCPPGLVCFNSQNGAACVECTQNSDCDDGIFCNGAEVCISLSCGLAVDPCDDANVCTADTCIESIQACTHAPDDAFDPDDGIFCNGVDFCQNGVLIVAPPIDCDDSSVCTTEFCDAGLDACVFANVPGNCDDNEACTENDVCVDGVCIGAPVGGNSSAEIDLGWDPTSPTVPNGEVLQVGLIISSADQTPATASIMKIIMKWDPTKLRLLGKVDNGPYTWQLSAFLDDSAQDGLNNSFDDGNAFYTAWSLPTNPVVIPDSGLLMTTMEFETLEPVQNTTLEIPLCLGATPTVTVIDGGAQGILTGILGSASVQISDCGVAADCDDGLFCNGVESCDLGVCVGGTTPCDDGNLCTDDSCNEAADVCVNTALTGDADQDGLFCNGTDRCENGVFVPGTPPICDDGNLCTNDSCDEALDACVSNPNSVPCDDGNACTVNDTCTGGACIGDVNPDCNACDFDIDCDDGILCTDDSCHPAGFCENIANNENCTDDGLFCNGQEVCDPAAGDPVTGCTSTGLPCPNCDEVTGCPCDTPLVEVMGNRYLRLTPQPPGSNVVTGLVVTSCGGTNVQYVGPLPGETGLIGFDQDGDGVEESTVGALVVDPANALWLTPAQWGGSVFVTGLFVTPDTTLEVQADCGDPFNPNLTAPVSITTSAYGDIDSDGAASLGDALLIVLGFQNNFKDTTRALVDLAPCVPDQTINLSDVQLGVLAFQGDPPFLFTCEESVCVP